MVNRKCPIFWPPYYVPKDHSKGIINYLRFMGSQRVGHDWATEPNWTLNILISKPSSYISCIYTK